MAILPEQQRPRVRCGGCQQDLIPPPGAGPDENGAYATSEGWKSDARVRPLFCTATGSGLHEPELGPA